MAVSDAGTLLLSLKSYLRKGYKSALKWKWRKEESMESHSKVTWRWGMKKGKLLLSCWWKWAQEQARHSLAHTCNLKQIFDLITDSAHEMETPVRQVKRYMSAAGARQRAHCTSSPLLPMIKMVITIRRTTTATMACKPFLPSFLSTGDQFNQTNSVRIDPKWINYEVLRAASLQHFLARSFSSLSFSTKESSSSGSNYILN